MTDPAMRAAVLERPGTLRVTAIPRPRPGDGQVLVRIGASGVNPLDTKIFEGAAPHARQPPPAVLGLDAAGTVEAYVTRATGGAGFDLVYDTAGGATLDASFQAVRRFGHVVSCLGWGTHALAPLSFRAGTYSGVFTLLPLLTGEGRKHHGDILREAGRLAEAGRLVPRLDPRQFALASVGEAYRAIKERSVRGKLVVDVEPADQAPRS